MLWPCTANTMQRPRAGSTHAAGFAPEGERVGAAAGHCARRPLAWRGFPGEKKAYKAKSSLAPLRGGLRLVPLCERFVACWHNLVSQEVPVKTSKRLSCFFEVGSPRSSFAGKCVSMGWPGWHRMAVASDSPIFFLCGLALHGVRCLLMEPRMVGPAVHHRQAVGIRSISRSFPRKPAFLKIR